jgi:Calx-beta domain
LIVKRIKTAVVNSFILDLIIIAFASIPAMAHGAVRNVPAGYGTIQAAIDAAADGDKIIIANGIYTGSGNIDLDFRGKAVTLRSADGPQGVIIDVQDQPGHRGVDFQNGETGAAVLQGITIQHGNADFGGGVRIALGSSPTIINCIIRSNTSGEGGGVDVSGAGACPTLRDVVISGNTAMAKSNDRGGGGLRAAGTGGVTAVTVIGGRIDGNTSYGSGGGILISRATLKITDSTISNNVTTSDSFSNHGGYDGGGIAVYGASSGDTTGDQSANAFIQNCTISGNRAWKEGGGLSFNQVRSTDTLQVVNTLIDDNVSSAVVPPDGQGNGAAVNAWQASPTFINTTITNNRELAGRSVIFAHTDGDSGMKTPMADIAIANSIIYDNTAGRVAGTSGGDSSVHITYSDVDDQATSGTHGNIDADPLFADPVNDDYHLRNDSPAIDAGSNAALPADRLDVNHNGNVIEAIPLDLDGATRRYDLRSAPDRGQGIAPIVDMGAYEAGRGVLRLEADEYPVSEAAGTATFLVRRVDGSDGKVSVDYAASDGTAAAGSDYAPNTGTLTWAAGDTAAKRFSLRIIDDRLDEGDETFHVTLSHPTGGAVLGNPAAATVTITDNDGNDDESIHPHSGTAHSTGAGGGGLIPSLRNWLNKVLFRNQL